MIGFRREGVRETSFSRDLIDKIMEKVDFDKGGGLVPTIVQDDKNKRVLMLAFMDREAFILTLETGKAHYWSRTRKKIWLKGETSGHFQMVKKVELDCDFDSALLSVEQLGVCCHTGKQTCFHNRLK